MLSGTSTLFVPCIYIGYLISDNPHKLPYQTLN